MASVTLDATVFAAICSLSTLVAFFVYAFVSWAIQERRMIELEKGLNAFRTMPATVQRGLKKAIKEELENIDWEEVIPEMAEGTSGWVQALQVAPYLMELYNKFKDGGSIMKDVVEGAVEAGAKTVKDVNKEEGTT